MKTRPSIIFVFTVFFYLFQSSQAQGQAAILALIFGEKVASENFNISMEIGGGFTNYSNISDTDLSKLGINFGIAGNLKMAENWFFSPNIYFLANRNLELNSFSLQTGNSNLDSEFMDLPTSVDLRYIDIPLLFSYQSNNKKMRYSLGPQISFVQSADASFAGVDGDFVQDVKGFTKSVDYGIMADVAYILGKAHKGKGVHIHARYCFGLTDVFTGEISPNDNRSGFFSVHLSLPFITDELAKKNLSD